MKIRVGLMFSGVLQRDGAGQPVSAAWGENKAMDETGRGLGECLVPAETYLRGLPQVQRPRKRVMGDYLYWFCADDPACVVTYSELESRLRSEYPGLDFSFGSPKLENLTRVLRIILGERRSGPEVSS